MVVKLFIVELLFHSFLTISSLEYCSIDCYTGKTQIHTMCQYQTEEVACEGGTVGVDDRFREVILHLQNVKREMIANGLVHGKPKAANMMELTWDKEVENIAQRWANQCPPVRSNAHDECRNTQDDVSVGQNVMLSYLNKNTGYNRTEIVEKGVDGWFNEYGNLPVGMENSFDGSDFELFKGFGHYTQMAWAESEYLGCGMVDKKPDTYEAYYIPTIIVCNYKPGGNYKDRPIYQVGEPCSACPPGTQCSKKYPGLCSRS